MMNYSHYHFGIGPYTAGAIASIAHKQQVCAIDGNLLRVYARLFAIEEDILKKKQNVKYKQLWSKIWPKIGRNESGINGFWIKYLYCKWQS